MQTWLYINMATNTNSLDKNNMELLELPEIWEDTDSLVTDFKRLLSNTKCCDVLFIIGKNKDRYQAHSLVLIARCSIFQDEKSIESPICKEQWRADVFEKVLKFVYTGKIELSSETTLETMRVALELNISKLVTKCEKYLMKQLSIENCCQFYTNTLNMFISSDSGRDIMKKCQSFIQENALDVVQTEGFLNLSKDALILLISTDEFGVKEEDIWRAALRWAKHQADIEQTVQDWTDEEREQIGMHLSGVIDHVRLLLVDSKVFAEEIEPTGIVPIELSLERYRYAAVPQAFHTYHDDMRLRPRVRSNTFHGTTILWKNNSKYQSVLNNWFGNKQQEWQLLFKATKDGFSAQTFHEKCDDYPETFTIVEGNNGNICGGFSDVPWKYDNGNGKYSDSTSCFLFSLINSEGFPPTRFEIVRPKYATLSHISIGPTFGAGPDLSIADNCNVNVLSYSRLSHSYERKDGSTIRMSLMGKPNFKVTDYEVFTPAKSEETFS